MQIKRQKEECTQERLDQGMLTLGIGPVGRIDTFVCRGCMKAASAIKAAQDRTTKEPGNRRLSIRSFPVLASRRAPVAMRIVDLPIS
jgi:hypothetical protein